MDKPKFDDLTPNNKIILSYGGRGSGKTLQYLKQIMEQNPSLIRSPEFLEEIPQSNLDDQRLTVAKLREVVEKLKCDRVPPKPYSYYLPYRKENIEIIRKCFDVKLELDDCIEKGIRFLLIDDIKVIEHAKYLHEYYASKKMKKEKNNYERSKLEIRRRNTLRG